MTADIDTDLGIKIGNGKKEVIEFTDVDCPFCKRAEDFFKNADVTRYIFLYPLDIYHPDAAMKSVHILCSADPAEEYIKVINGHISEFNSCREGEETLKIHRAYGARLGVSGTPFFRIDGTDINGADPKIAEMIK